MTKKLNLEGQTFGRLKVLREACPSRWVCECTCGTVKDYHRSVLRRGTTKSCGCLNQELRQISNLKHGQSRGQGTRLYTCWKSMKARCYYDKGQYFKHYGGRGISVCESWRHSFEEFQSWALAAGYADTLLLDRLDPEQNYSPDNCRWVSAYESANNTRRNVFVEIAGERLALSIAAKRFGVGLERVRDRLKLGWELEQALTAPRYARRKR